MCSAAAADATGRWPRMGRPRDCSPISQWGRSNTKWDLGVSRVGKERNRNGMLSLGQLPSGSHEALTGTKIATPFWANSVRYRCDRGRSEGLRCKVLSIKQLQDGIIQLIILDICNENTADPIAVVLIITAMTTVWLTRNVRGPN